MNIRTASAADLEQIAALYIRNHKSTYADLLPESYLSGLTLAYGMEKWGDYMQCPEKRVWVACEGAAVLGFAAGMPDIALAQTWYLDSLHAAEAARGKGVGSALIRTAARSAAEQGFRRMSVCIIRGNDRARALYTKLGAVHSLYFEDCFRGTRTSSEKLLWEVLPLAE